VEAVSKALENKLTEMREQNIQPDVLTFAGNGEPTSHPHFSEIIDETIRLRNDFCPKAKISVLSNSTFISHKSVRDALMKVDNNILKLDTISNDYIRMVDRPTSPSYDAAKIIENMKAFNGKLIIQTMFMKGKTEEGEDVDNTGEEFVAPWLDAVKDIAPRSVMIYTIDRETPDSFLQKATHEELDIIKARVEKLGIECSASY
jgi:wyosine [tRNA(Phe)-imidazoG37] synthetase (radical SAM superfamily)